MSEIASSPAVARDIGLDVARGLLMAWIIIVIHGIFWLGVAPTGPGSFLLFEMPPIFLITGVAYFLGEGMKANRLGPSNYVDFLVRRGVRIYVPYLAYVLAAAVLVTALRWDGAPSLDDVAGRLWAWLNPVTRGAGHTWKMLSWHLWFVAPFLVVTALMPMLTVKRLPKAIKPWMLAAIAGILVLALNRVTFAAPFDDQLIKNTVFYAFWAAFGVLLAAMPRRWRRADYALVLALAVLGIAAATALQPMTVTLDMQRNKFPPNAMFWLFSCAWMAALLIAARSISAETVAALGRSWALKPFMSAGYSIYLWQGMAYSLASYAGEVFALNRYYVWVAAIALSIAMGLIAAPLERIRFPKRRSV